MVEFQAKLLPRTIPLVLLSLSLSASLGCRPKIILEQPGTTTSSAQPDPEPEPEDALEPDRRAIREAIRGYTVALDERDGPTAAALVVPETVGFYEDLRIAALRAERDQLEAWDLISVLMVLQIRSRVSRSELELLDGAALFERAVIDGLVGDATTDVPLDEVWVDAAGFAELRIEDDPILWLSRSADGRWLVDLPTTVTHLASSFEETAVVSLDADGKLRTAMVLLELSTDDFVDVAVLEGPLELIPE